jgi:hypothetical protein
MYVSPQPHLSTTIPSYTSSVNQGATPRELVVEACRRDNVDLLIETLGTISKDKSTQEVADFMNNVKDSLGNHALHIAAQYGASMPPLPPPSSPPQFPTHFPEATPH